MILEIKDVVELGKHIQLIMPRFEIYNRTRGKQNGRKFLSCFIYVLTRVEVCAWGSVRNGEWGFGGLVSPFSLLALIFHGL